MNATQTRFPRTSAGVEAGLPMAKLVSAKPLTKEELRDLGLFELRIVEGLQRAGKLFTEIGGYLEEIRERRLYRAEFATWADYCRVRWNRTTAWALMQRKAAGLVKQLGDAEETTPNRKHVCDLKTEGPRPTGAGQVQALASLPPAERVEAWHEAVEMSGNGDPTRAQVEEAARRRKPTSAAQSGERLAKILAAAGLARERLEILRKLVDGTDSESQAALRLALLQVQVVEKKLRKELSA